jgi:hypothetical protein
VPDPADTGGRRRVVTRGLYGAFHARIVRAGRT